MKKSAVILSIVSAVLLIVAGVLIYFTPEMLGEASYIVVDAGGSKLSTILALAQTAWGMKGLVFKPEFYAQSAILFALPVSIGLIAVLWLVHFILLIAKRRPSALFPNLFGLIFGSVSFVFFVALLMPNIFGTDVGNLPNILAKAKLDPLKLVLAYAPYVLAAIAYALILAAYIISMVDVCKYPGKVRKTHAKGKKCGSLKDPLFAAENDSNVTSGATLANNASAAAPAPAVIGKDGYSGSSPTIVQYIYNNSTPEGAKKKEEPALTKDELRSLIRDELGKDEKKENSAPIAESDIMTSDDLRNLIREEMDKKEGVKPVENDEKVDDNEDILDRKELRRVVAEEIAKANGKVVEEETKEDNGPLTTDDLRTIIAEEMAKANGEEVAEEKEEKDNSNTEVLSEDELRKIIAEEIAKANGTENKAVEEAVPEEEGSDVLTSDDLRSIIAEEVKKAIAPEEKEIEEEKGDIATVDDLRSIIRQELKGTEEKPAEEEPVEEKKEDEGNDEVLTSDDLRSIIREELKSQVEEAAPEVVVPANVEEEKPLTANDLRSLIQEALEEHDNPERRQLTEDEARELIVQQVRSYYLGKREEEKNDNEALKAKEEAEAKAKEEEEKRLALEKTLQEEVEARKKEREEREKDREERLAAEKNREKISVEDIRNIVRSELESAKPAESKVDETSKEDIKELIRSELSTFREEQAKANEKAAQEAADAHLIEQARAEAEAEESKAQSEEIKNLKENAITSEDVRNIISEEIANIPAVEHVTSEEVRSIIGEELDKRFAELIEAQKEALKAAPAPAPVEDKPEEKKEEAQPAPAPTQTIVIHVGQPASVVGEKKEEPAPVIEAKEEPIAPAAEVKEEPKEEAKEEAKVEEAAPTPEKPKIVRIPFNERMAQADKETQENYNELKAECLSYGLKSRLSNSGDTFRLHTKTYVKITIAGKGLKLYLALNPKDYENSPIPLHDAGKKNIYKDIPGVFKVKSPLSLRRAKQLVADACEKDNLEQGKIVNRDYFADLKDYVPQLGGKKDEEDVEEDED